MPPQSPPGAPRPRQPFWQLLCLVLTTTLLPHPVLTLAHSAPSASHPEDDRSLKTRTLFSTVHSHARLDPVPVSRPSRQVITRLRGGGAHATFTSAEKLHQGRTSRFQSPKGRARCHGPPCGAQPLQPSSVALCSPHATLGGRDGAPYAREAHSTSCMTSSRLPPTRTSAHFPHGEAWASPLPPPLRPAPRGQQVFQTRASQM